MNHVERYRSARRDPTLVVLEGFHPVKHALRFGARLRDLVVREGTDVDALAAALAPDVRAKLADAVVVDPETFADLGPRPVDTGLIGLAERPPNAALARVVAGGAAPIVLLEHPRRLGNLGAAVRVAAAAGAEGLVALGSLDPWSPQAVRGAAGLQFALPVERAEHLPSSPRPLVALVPDGRPLGSTPLPTGAIVAFGGERDGLSPELRERADLSLSIPMRPGVSSLNLATAVAVCLYWWRLAGPPGLLHRPQRDG